MCSDHSVWRQQLSERHNLAGIAVGYWEDVEDVRANWALSRTFHADMTDEKRQHLLKGWKKAVGRAFEWAED